MWEDCREWKKKEVWQEGERERWMKEIEREGGGGMENVRKYGKCKRKQKSIAGACVRACMRACVYRAGMSESRELKLTLTQEID